MNTHACIVPLVQGVRMATRAESPQDERRDKRGIAQVTVAEKRALRVVAAHRGVTESDLMRDATLEDVVDEYERIEAALVGVV